MQVDKLASSLKFCQLCSVSMVLTTAKEKEKSLRR